MAEFSIDQRFLIGCANAGLQPGETSQDAAVGILAGLNDGKDLVRCPAAMLITDRRVLVQYDRSGGYKRLGFEYRDIPAARHESEKQFGSIVLQTSAGELRISQVPRVTATRVAARVREQIAALGLDAHADLPTQAPAVGQSAPFSVADEIRKLADLRADGILTDAEFAAKKEQLLGYALPRNPPVES